MKDLFTLFVKELKDIYSAEHQIINALPEIAKSAHSPALKKALHEHLQETKLHLQRLDAIASEINEKLTGTECKMVADLLKDGHKITKSEYENYAKDAGIIHIVQHLEHYEIATYGTLKSFAKQLKLEFVENLLHDMAKEAGESDKNLTKLAEGNVFEAGINCKAKRHCA